ncbi:twin-arginine translocase subunit TatC [Mumia sp. zg.B53]|uniref:twin-arginine translocase subunit TatC n=1 Tax=unclassified Mumia TaxID=2621872 RepID=UPI001C6F2755|nr:MULTISPECIES: twin-arginine translocase subunit TatC [unclassified Mumia]MBW9205078.1 twin-arginine translocase subunit TatC [Mumia sp. zg.B17]MBW9208918.1 twin-arginine translocase subunit TatC [Mumia sp. zg.B21]MBW9213530.1 twin-arginine translocase subunit TatC [Mumia sp. zg.B53]MDD9349285.1 twin-arginine translocase subunit TatC [Mumia sp.]
MPLAEHLRELRDRLLRAVLAIVAGTVVAAFFYDQLLDFLTVPYFEAVETLEENGRDINEALTFSGIADPFTFALKISLVAGLVVSSPVWLYQIWAFIVPALHRNERRWTILFCAIAGPLFIIGFVTGYLVLPKGIELLMGFTPDFASNFNALPDYLSFVLRILLVFSVAFEIPLFVVLLNGMGAVSGRQLAGARSWIIVATFVFAAIATPSTDPLTMVVLALPMTVLFLIAEGIAHLTDRRRAKRAVAEGLAVSDDEMSDITVEHRLEDERPSDLDAPDDPRSAP